MKDVLKWPCPIRLLSFGLAKYTFQQWWNEPSKFIAFRNMYKHKIAKGPHGLILRMPRAIACADLLGTLCLPFPRFLHIFDGNNWGSRPWQWHPRQNGHEQIIVFKISWRRMSKQRSTRGGVALLFRIAKPEARSCVNCGCKFHRS